MERGFPWAENKIIEHTKLLINSFHYWTKKDLIGTTSNLIDNSFLLYHASFVVISHGAESDPIFNYANEKALKLWQMNWERFTAMPSRLSAEPIEVSERQKLLDEASKNGFIRDFVGVRISSQGEKFKIKDTILWNVIDEKGNYRGQAAKIGNWEYL